MRVNIRRILAMDNLREDIFVRVIVATQAREGIITTEQQAREAYRKVSKEHDRVRAIIKNGNSSL